MANNNNAQPEPIQITFTKGTDIGRARDHNEDYVDAFSPSDPTQRHQKGHLFIVADGMGGHQAGEVASEGAVRTISREYYADPDPDVRGSLTRAIKQANAFIYQQAQQMTSRIGMGTTVVAAVVRGRELYLANVGDSRAYMMRHGKVNKVTRDHSFVEEQIRAGILTREEARTHPQRNVITRALGSKPEVQVDTYSGELRPGDTLLLCSDGLSEYVQEEDMAQILGQYPPKETVPRLIALANKHGGSDNISALVVQAGPPAGVAPRQAATAAARPAAAPGRKRLALPWIIGIGFIALIVVAILVAGAFYVSSRLGKETLTPTPTSILTPAVTTPSTTLAATATPTLEPTSTPRPTEGAPTTTPLIAFSELEPLDETSVQLGASVIFRWKWIGALPEQFAFVVRLNGEEVCQSDQESCLVPLSVVGEHTWWVELWEGGQMLKESDHLTLQVRVPPSPTLTLTPSPLPITITPPLLPSPTDDSGGGGGGGGGGDGGGEAEPTKPSERDE